MKIIYLILSLVNTEYIIDKRYRTFNLQSLNLIWKIYSFNSVQIKLIYFFN